MLGDRATAADPFCVGASSKSLAGPKRTVLDPWPAAAQGSKGFRLACGGRRDGATRHDAGRALEADVGCRVHVAVGVIEIEPVVLVRHQLRAQAEYPAVIHMIERAVQRDGSRPYCSCCYAVPGRYRRRRSSPMSLACTCVCTL